MKYIMSHKHPLSNVDSPPSKKVTTGSNAPTFLIPCITVLYDHVVKTKPLGWTFSQFYQTKDFLKNISNRNSLSTMFGEEEFKPFCNLRTKWMPTSSLGMNLWVVKIDANGDDCNFPQGEVGIGIAWANKFAQAVIKEKIFKEVQIKECYLSESEQNDFLEKCMSFHLFKIIV